MSAEICTTQQVYNMSKLCPGNVDLDGCYPPRFSGPLATFAGVWCILNAVVGIIGNLMTLVAIPYAAKKKL